jgi:hypothetical protein
MRPGWESRVDRLVTKALDEPGVNPEIGVLWVDRFTSVGKWGRRRKLFKIDPRSELGRRARYAYAGALGTRKQLQHLKKFVRRERQTLHESIGTWGQVGYAFAANGRWRDVISWMSDWRERRGLEPWMLSNLALALRHEKRHADARLANEHALGLRGDQTTTEHHAWMALETALEGQIDEARAHLERSQKPNNSRITNGAHALANALIAVNSAAPELRTAVFNEQRNILRDPQFRSSFRSPILKGTGDRAVKQMAAAAGTKPFRLTRFTDQFAPKSDGQLVAAIAWGIVILIILAGMISAIVNPSPSSSAKYNSRYSATPKRWATPKVRIPVEERIKARQLQNQNAGAPAEDRPVITLQIPNRPALPPIRLEPIPTPKPAPKSDQK